MKSFAVALTVFGFMAAPAGAQSRYITDMNGATIEQKLAIINSDRPVRVDDVSIARFRFLTQELARAAKEDREKVANVLAYSHKMLRRDYGKDVTLLAFAEELYKGRQALRQMDFTRYSVVMLMLMGQQ
jgi:hypothetical protein